MKKLFVSFILALLSINNLYACAPIFHAILYENVDTSTCSWGRPSSIGVIRNYQIKWSDNAVTNSGETFRAFGQCYGERHCLPEYIQVTYENNGSIGGFRVSVSNKKQVGINLDCVEDYVSIKRVNHTCGTTGCNQCAVFSDAPEDSDLS